MKKKIIIISIREKNHSAAIEVFIVVKTFAAAAAAAVISQFRLWSRKPCRPLFALLFLFYHAATVIGVIAFSYTTTTAVGR